MIATILLFTASAICLLYSFLIFRAFRRTNAELRAKYCSIWNSGICLGLILMSAGTLIEDASRERGILNWLNLIVILCGTAALLLDLHARARLVGKPAVPTARLELPPESKPPRK